MTDSLPYHDGVVITPRQTHTLLLLASLFDPATGNLGSLEELLKTWIALSKLGVIGRVLLALVVGIAAIAGVITQILSYLHQPTR